MAQEVQTVIFSKDNWTVERARTWLDDHDMRSDKVDENDTELRFRQFDPSECAEDSFQTLTQNMPDGVRMVACDRQGKSLRMPDPETLALLESRFWKGQIDGQPALRVRKGFLASVEADKANNGRIRLTISTDSVDRAGDVIEVTGWDFMNYMRNPIVLFDHQYGEVAGSPPAQGKTLDLSVLKHKVNTVMQFHLQTRFNMELYAMYRDGFMGTASVGFLPTVQPDLIRAEGSDTITGLRFKGQELLEYSLVAVPMNADAVQLAMQKGIIRPRTAEYLQSLGTGGAVRTPSKVENTRTPAESLLRAMQIQRWEDVARRIAR